MYLVEYTAEQVFPLSPWYSPWPLPPGKAKPAARETEVRRAMRVLMKSIVTVLAVLD